MIEIVENNYKSNKPKYLLRCPNCKSLLKVDIDDLHPKENDLVYHCFDLAKPEGRYVFRLWYDCPACNCAAVIWSDELEEKRIEEE